MALVAMATCGDDDTSDDDGAQVAAQAASTAPELPAVGGTGTTGLGESTTGETTGAPWAAERWWRSGAAGARPVRRTVAPGRT